MARVAVAARPQDFTPNGFIRIGQDGRVTIVALRINEMPAIDVHIVASNESPGGMGEPGTSAIVPTVFNAVYAATGVRLCRPPITPDVLKN